MGKHRTSNGTRAAVAVIGLMASLSLGCGEMTTRTWITIVEEESGGSVTLIPAAAPPAEFDMVRLQGGFLAEVTINLGDLPNPMNGQIHLADVRIAGEVEGLVGTLCTWNDPEGFSGGPLVVDIFGGSAESSMFLDAYALSGVQQAFGLPPVEFEQEIDFDIGSAFDMVKFAEAFLTGSADGLFATESTIASSMNMLGIDAIFEMNTRVTNGGVPPVFDADLAAVCGPQFATQGVGDDHVEIMNVKSSYLRHAGKDRPNDPKVIPLAELGFAPGDVIRISTVGTYAPTIALADGLETKLGAVFSATDEILPSGQLFRIPGAIEAGANINTWPSIVCFFGVCDDKGGDDILVDFRVDPQVTITVPAGANYLVVAPIDGFRFYGDNTSLGFGVRIEDVTP